jgi:RNA ligase (TIGR02306 family)
LRKLASIQLIEALRPIEGADAIEVAEVLGWDVVVKKGEFRPGDLCVYFEIDSFLPVREEFEFLRSSSHRSHPELGEGFRLRTVKLRGQISQGLALPTTVFERDGLAGYKDVGKDVTEDLCVRKYEVPITGKALAGNAKGNFPDFIRKTDQERIQNLRGKIASFAAETFEVTLKLDGSSMTVYHKDGEVGVCSRNIDLKDEDGSKFWEVAKRSGLVGALKSLNWDIAVQGELMGPGVQGNRENFPTHRMFVFDIWNIDLQRYLTPEERYKALETLEGAGAVLESVPIEGIVAFPPEECAWGVPDFLQIAERPSLNHPIAEGVVFKSHRPNGPTFKAISNRFLLKEK